MIGNVKLCIRAFPMMRQNRPGLPSYLSVRARQQASQPCDRPVLALDVRVDELADGRAVQQVTGDVWTAFDRSRVAC